MFFPTAPCSKKLNQPNERACIQFFNLQKYEFIVSNIVNSESRKKTKYNIRNDCEEIKLYEHYVLQINPFL